MEAARSTIMNVAMNSTQKADELPWIGLVVIRLVSTP